MRLPDFSNVIIDGVAFADAGGKAQSRFIAAQLDEHKRKEAGTDPGALTKAERERLGTAEAKLAEAMAAHDSAAQRWVDLSARRWKGQHERSLVDGVVQRVARGLPTEGEIGVAVQHKEAAEHTLQQTLIATNRERQEVDGARWWRRHEAERGAPTKGR